MIMIMLQVSKLSLSSTRGVGVDKLTSKLN